MKAHDEAGEGVTDPERALARRLAEPGIVTDRQALAYVLRDVQGISRPDAARLMGCSKSNLDTLLDRARSHLDDAAATLSVLHDLDSTPALARLD
jgi:DNA-directed RNA polymerase specialized sigma24 family protein